MNTTDFCQNVPNVGQEGASIAISYLGQEPTMINGFVSGSIEEIFREKGFDPQPSYFFFSGECVDALGETSSGGEEDHQEPVDGRRSPGEIGQDCRHIYCHRCRRVSVVVAFGSQQTHRRFSPTATVKTVRLWAARRFGMALVKAETLALCVTDQPDRHLANTTEVGALVSNDSCEVSLLLAEDKTKLFVNGNPVVIIGRRHTGLEIKQAAVTQGLNIQLDFVLSLECGLGRTKIIGDTDEVNLDADSRFCAIADDDNS